jgi:hypothetical protein
MYDVKQLLALSQAQLDDLFKASPTGDIPDGPAQGTAIIAPGTSCSQSIADIINPLRMAGKSVRCEQGHAEE